MEQKQVNTKGKNTKSGVKNLSLHELIDCIKACDLIIDRTVKSADSYRGVPTQFMSDTEKEEYEILNKKYKEYIDVENKILGIIEKKIKELDV